MSFREKTAWLTLVCMGAAYAVYFTWAVQAGEQPLIRLIWWFGGVTMVQVILVVSGSIALALQARGEARAPADERDRAIARRGASTSYYVLMVSMILVGVVMPFGNNRWEIINAALLALVVAEAARHLLIVSSYRRGWRG